MAAVRLITDLHDAMVEHGDHELADGVLELARYPAKYWGAELLWSCRLRAGATREPLLG